MLLGVPLLLECLPLYLSLRLSRPASACHCHSPMAQCQVDMWHPFSSQHMSQDCPCTSQACSMSKQRRLSQSAPWATHLWEVGLGVVAHAADDCIKHSRLQSLLGVCTWSLAAAAVLLMAMPCDWAGLGLVLRGAGLGQGSRHSVVSLRGGWAVLSAAG